jgi:hypothetical protein
MPDYKDDTVDGQVRPAGSHDYIQARIVAPLAFESFTILPRLTLRHYENVQGQSGFGNTELFVYWQWRHDPKLRLGFTRVVRSHWGAFWQDFLGPKSSWNVYGEYQTSLFYDDYPESAVANSYRINVTYTMPGL